MENNTLVNFTSFSHSKLGKKVIDSLKKEFKVECGEEQILAYVMTRREQIINKHIRDVYPINELHQKGKTYYYTKLTPESHNHCGRITASTKEALNDKIVAFYLDISTTKNPRIEAILAKALAESNPKTALRSKQLFNKNLSSLANIQISFLTEEDIHNALSTLLKNGIKKKAFNNTVSLLNKINDYCSYYHIKSINIRNAIANYRRVFMKSKNLFIPDCIDPRDTAFDEDETTQLLQYAINNPDFYTLAIGLLLTTGLRMGEILALKPSDIRLKEHYVNIFRIEDTRTFEILENYAKAGSVRQVFLNNDAETIIKKILELRKKEKTTCEYLLVNPLSPNVKLHISSCDKHLRALQVKLGFDDTKDIRSLHDCRRTYASIQYLKGVDITIIQKQLGHTTVTQTWDYIKDIIDNRTRVEAINKGTLLAV